MNHNPPDNATTPRSVDQQQACSRLERLRNMALELNAQMPADVALKGDGSIWTTTHGNEGSVRLKKLTQEQVLRLIYTAKEFGERMISV